MTFEEKLELLTQLVLRARAHFDFWWIYEGEPTRPTYTPAMNRFSEFFRFDLHAQLVSLTMYLCQIFETRSDTHNLRGLLEEAKAAAIPRGTIEAAEEAIDEGEGIRKKLVVLRHKLFAHRDLNLSYEDTFRKASITPDEIRRMSECGLEAVNGLWQGMGAVPREFSPLPERDLLALLEMITATG